MNRFIHSLLRPFALSDRQPPICRRRRFHNVSSPWRRLGGVSGVAIGRTFRNSHPMTAVRVADAGGAVAAAAWGGRFAVGKWADSVK